MTERSAREHEGKKKEKEGGKEQEKRGFYSVFTPPMGTPVSERRPAECPVAPPLRVTYI
jgi:hypothetical protein